jgi:hypothetical protein
LLKIISRSGRRSNISIDQCNQPDKKDKSPAFGAGLFYLIGGCRHNPLTMNDRHFGSGMYLALIKPSFQYIPRSAIDKDLDKKNIEKPR